MVNELEKQKFGVAITAMLETFGQESTPARLLGYWMGLRDFTLSQIENSVCSCLRTATRLPVPADLRAIISGGSSSELAITAWSDVQCAANASYMKDLDFEDRIINAVIRNLGGRWNFFERLNASAESEKWLRLDFIKAYAVFAQEIPSDEAISPLIGQATHGLVSGRMHNPRIDFIKCDEKRAALTSSLRSAAIANGTAFPVSKTAKIDFQKA